MTKSNKEISELNEAPKVKDMSTREKVKKSLNFAFIMLLIIVVVSFLATMFAVNAITTEEAQRFEVIEDYDVIIDINNDGYEDYIKYIYVEAIFGTELGVDINLSDTVQE